MNESVTKMHPYDFAATLAELDGGVFIQKLSHAMHQTAAAVVGHGRTGKVTQPAPTITAGGCHLGEVRAFLMKYYGTGGQHQDCREPLHTVPTKARFGLVTIGGQDWQIVDIGIRMLTPRELFRCQGFPDSYRIDLEHNGKRLSKAAQIRMCGNSVSPPPAIALLQANVAADEQEHAA